MSRLSGLNSISVNGLINISADTVNTTTISNNELNALDNIDTNQTIQNQIDNINTSISNIGTSVTSSSVYTNNLYINGSLINWASYITSGYLNTALASYATLSYLNGFRTIQQMKLSTEQEHIQIIQMAQFKHANNIQMQQQLD